MGARVSNAGNVLTRVVEHGSSRSDDAWAYTYDAAVVRMALGGVRGSPLRASPSPSR